MSIPKLLIGLGVFLVVLGLVAAVLQRYPWSYSWFGKLPGDISYEGRGTFVYAPIASMLLISVVLSVVAYLFQRLGR